MGYIRRTMSVFFIVIFLLQGCTSTGQKSAESPQATSTSLTVNNTYSDVTDSLSTQAGDNPKIKVLLEQLKTESPGVAGWLTGFANSEKIIFYDHAHMLAYNLTKRQFIGSIELKPIDGGHIQGSIVTCFSFSPQGDFVIIDNGFRTPDQNPATAMYLADIRTGLVTEIAKANYFNVIDAWSPSSRFYAFSTADEDGNTVVTVYDVVQREKKAATIALGRAKRLVVTDSGDVFLDADSFYCLNRKNAYQVDKVGINGDLLDVQGEDLVYYENGLIRKFNFKGNMETLQNIKSGFQLRSVKNGQAVFTGSSASLVYNMAENKLYEYNFTYETFPGLLEWSIAPDSRHCVLNDDRFYRVIDEKGVEETIAASNENRFAWIDNSTFASVTFQDRKDIKAGFFKVITYDLKGKQRRILFEQK